MLMDEGMVITALRCRLKRGDEPQLDVSRWTGSVSGLAARNAAGAYLVSESTLRSVGELSALTNDRGRKHPAVPLSRVLIGQPRVPVVRAEFTSHGQLVRSVRTQLERAALAGEHKAYVIGVPPAILERVAARASVACHPPGVGHPEPFVLMDPEEVPRQVEEMLIGASHDIRVVRQQIVRFAQYDEPVLVLGETGTGKEVVARAIHLLSGRQPFLAVNCAAVPRELFESEPFGYAPGAFTGALRQGSHGLWQSARGGTIFLDEIGDLAPAHQVKLLRVIEEKKVRPVGAAREVDVDARVIAATNRDLHLMVQSGEFREDLYYRLAMVIRLTHLRERPEDITALAKHFWQRSRPGGPRSPPTC